MAATIISIPTGSEHKIVLRSSRCRHRAKSVVIILSAVSKPFTHLFRTLSCVCRPCSGLLCSESAYYGELGASAMVCRCHLRVWTVASGLAV